MVMQIERKPKTSENAYIRPFEAKVGRKMVGKAKSDLKLALQEAQHQTFVLSSDERLDSLPQTTMHLNDISLQPVAPRRASPAALVTNGHICWITA